MSTPAPSPVARLRRSPIRRLEPDDLPAVASLYERTMRSGSATPAPGLADYFARVLDHPWADPELPSLVFVDQDGAIAGFLASHVRNMALDGRPLRMACSGPLVVDVASRHRAAGAQLMRVYLAGGQDITITDGATPLVRRMWSMLGGVTAQLRSLDWIRVLRPTAMAADVALRARGHEHRPPALWRATALPDALLARSRRIALTAPDGLRDEPLTPALVLANQALLSTGARLQPDYDAAYLSWLLRELAAVRTRGPLVARMLRRGGGDAVGWYLAFVPEHGIARVLQVAARPRDVGAVLDHLLWTARARGATAVRGRLEPQLLEAVSARGCVLRHSGEALLHARSADLAAVATSSSAVMTLLEGEWWMEPHRL